MMQNIHPEQVVLSRKPQPRQHIATPNSLIPRTKLRLTGGSGFRVYGLGSMLSGEMCLQGAKHCLESLSLGYSKPGQLSDEILALGYQLLFHRAATMVKKTVTLNPPVDPHRSLKGSLKGPSGILIEPKPPSTQPLGPGPNLAESRAQNTRRAPRPN